MGITYLLTDEEAELLAETILENGDIQSVMEGLSNPDLAASASALAENFNNINPNNPESDISKIASLQKAADSANTAVESASALKEEYEANEEQRIIDKIALDEIWAKSEIVAVEETEISVTTGYDTGIGATRKELTSEERRERGSILVYQTQDIVDLILVAKTEYLPNGLRDLDQRNVRVWRYLDIAERMLTEIKNFNMSNVVLRSSFKVPVVQNKLGELINFYNDWETWNPELYNLISNIYDELSNLSDLMDRYKNELSLL